MKKHNEGYTLVLVMALVLVLSVLTSVILGAAQRNLDAHRSGVAYMQAKYQAMGEIEKIVAKLDKMTADDDSVDTICNSDGNPSVEIARLDHDKVQIRILAYAPIQNSETEVVEVECTLLLVDGLIDEHGEVVNLTRYHYTSYQNSRKEVASNDETP